MTSTQVNKKQEKITFEYFDEKRDFYTFVHQREKSLNAILQEFIVPIKDHNQMIKVIWSPQFCLIYRKTNYNKIYAKNIPANERLSTFEGAEYLCKSDSMSSTLLST